MNYQKHKITDSEIVRRILSGEKELYEIILRRNNQKLYRVVRGYLTNEEEIEDVMQDSYLNAFEKLHQFKHDAQFSTWLIRIGINQALMRIRKTNKTYSLESCSSHQNTRVMEIPDYNQPNPEKLLIGQESKAILERTIDSLNEKYRMVYILKEVEGMSIVEISNCLDLSNSNVKVRLHRAKSMLKEKLFELTSKTELFEFGNARCDRITQFVIERI